MTVRARQFTLLVLLDFLAGGSENPLPSTYHSSPVSRLVAENDGERDLLDAAPPVFIDAATILLCATDRLEEFRAALNLSESEIIAKAAAALRAMGRQPPAAFVDWKPYTQASLAAELTKLAALGTRH
jgi:hypothetical protein